MTAAATPGPRQGRGGPSFSDASPAQVRAALIPEEAAEFDREWREVMARATESLDLTELFETLESWRFVARITAAQGAEAHRALYRRAAAKLTGDQVPADEPLATTKARLGLA
ncbi:hypothetical protein ALI22I_40405 [Saccharothrix sp. ALI-22-I]|uniref:DUF6247 family protein n=1 Tax=Saccharothrix sp. ALI-22-I TaxID=1933778 RepID=UPI00097C25D9|nr:DUF6247 family protein [Saccharothrix sp. ALI-22-I]ONI82369.1 hypothetical protein ALI22I_40405 [Saccharothrix sp. ALI-22-I]